MQIHGVPGEQVQVKFPVISELVDLSHLSIDVVESYNLLENILCNREFVKEICTRYSLFLSLDGSEALWGEIQNQSNLLNSDPVLFSWRNVWKVLNFKDVEEGELWLRTWMDKYLDHQSHENKERMVTVILDAFCFVFVWFQENRLHRNCTEFYQISNYLGKNGCKTLLEEIEQNPNETLTGPCTATGIDCTTFYRSSKNSD